MSRARSGDLCQGRFDLDQSSSNVFDRPVPRSRSRQKISRRSEPDSFRRDRPSAHPHFRWRKGMTLAQGRYEVHGRLGEGTFGRVLAAKDLQTGESVAVKVGKGGDEFCEQAVEEVEILQHIQHLHPGRESFCVKFLDSFLEPPKHFCLVFERLGISLRDFLKRNSSCGLFVEDLRRIAQQLLQGLAGLHTAGILHTDLKCRNVMLNDERYCAAPHPRDPGTEALRPQDCSIRIVDFGSAIHQDETFRGRACTRQFRSPEVALGLQWDEKLDIWSAGCIIAMLYTGVRPFSVHENQEHLAMME
ncbi:lkh1, partial [Symbiodinium sp. KB8]